MKLLKKLGAWPYWLGMATLVALATVSVTRFRSGNCCFTDPDKPGIYYVVPAPEVYKLPR